MKGIEEIKRILIKYDFNLQDNEIDKISLDINNFWITMLEEVD